MDCDNHAQLLAQTPMVYEQHYYLHIGGRQIEVSPFELLAGLALVALAIVAVAVSYIVYRNRIKKRAK